MECSAYHVKWQVEVIYIESREKILSIVVTKLATEYDQEYI
jgi:hypothetical protein